MNGETRVYETPAGIKLGALDQIAPDGARSFVVQFRAGRFHGFVVRRDDAVFGYVDRCPHMGLPLAKVLDDYLTPAGNLLACSWHSALFEIESGLCVGGPCTGASLTAWPVHVQLGTIVTGAAPDAGEIAKA